MFTMTRKWGIHSNNETVKYSGRGTITSEQGGTLLAYQDPAGSQLRADVQLGAARRQNVLIP